MASSTPQKQSDPTTSRPAQEDSTTSRSPQEDPTRSRSHQVDPTTSRPPQEDATTSRPPQGDPTTLRLPQENPTTSRPAQEDPTTSRSPQEDPTRSRSHQVDPTTSRPPQENATTSRPPQGDPTTLRPPQGESKGRHDHVFQIIIMNPGEPMTPEEAWVQVYRSAIRHSFVAFTYKWGRYREETKEICLLQACSVEGLSVCHRVRKGYETVPGYIQAVLRNENICKVGIFPEPLFSSPEFSFQVNNALDLRYAAQVSGFAPTNLTGLTKSVLGLSVNIYRGIKPTDKYFYETNFHTKSISLEVNVTVKVFLKIRQYYNWHFGSHFEDRCEIFKNKLFRIGRPAS